MSHDALQHVLSDLEAVVGPYKLFYYVGNAITTTTHHDFEQGPSVTGTPAHSPGTVRGDGPHIEHDLAFIMPQTAYVRPTTRAPGSSDPGSDVGPADNLGIAPVLTPNHSCNPVLALNEYSEMDIDPALRAESLSVGEDDSSQMVTRTENGGSDDDDRTIIDMTTHQTIVHKLKSHLSAAIAGNRWAEDTGLLAVRPSTANSTITYASSLADHQDLDYTTSTPCKANEPVRNALKTLHSRPKSEPTGRSCSNPSMVCAQKIIRAQNFRNNEEIETRLSQHFWMIYGIPRRLICQLIVGILHELYPLRRRHFPYVKKHAPPWWPVGIPYTDPAHLIMDHRTYLLQYFLVNTQYPAHRVFTAALSCVHQDLLHPRGRRGIPFTEADQATLSAVIDEANKIRMYKTIGVFSE